MSFNSEEIANANYEGVKGYLTKNIEESEVPNSVNKLKEIINECGPVVDAYPSWHPLAIGISDAYDPRNLRRPHPPLNQEFYRPLDHRVLFRNGIIACPYTNSSNVKDAFDAVESLPPNNLFDITIEEIDDVQFYNHATVATPHTATTPLLVRCEWYEESHSTFPASLVIPLILEQELPHWRWAEGAAKWEDMLDHFLGSPHEDDSSLFVSKEVGTAVKKIWNTLVDE